MLYQILAELVLGIHFLFIMYVVCGALLVVKWNWTVVLHLPAALWGSVIMFAGWICPLTPLENHLRQLAGGEGYDGSFIEQYIMPLVYPEPLTRELQIYLGIAVVSINVVLYGLVVRRMRMWRRP